MIKEALGKLVGTLLGALLGVGTELFFGDTDWYRPVIWAAAGALVWWILLGLHALFKKLRNTGGPTMAQLSQPGSSFLPPEKVGIRITGGGGHKIQGTKISGLDVGIDVHDSSGNEIEDVDIRD
jgi:hypothetical protein